MQRNEVWWANLPLPSGPRPVVILTRSDVLGSLDYIVVALITRTIRGLSSEVRLGKREGLTTPCVASLDNILTVRRNRLIRLLGSLAGPKVAELDAALRFALSFQ